MLTTLTISLVISVLVIVVMGRVIYNQKKENTFWKHELSNRKIELVRTEEELSKWKPAPIEDDGEGYW